MTFIAGQSFLPISTFSPDPNTLSTFSIESDRNCNTHCRGNEQLHFDNNQCHFTPAVLLTVVYVCDWPLRFR
jgi:hypothetical protein